MTSSKSPRLILCQKSSGYYLGLKQFMIMQSIQHHEYLILFRTSSAPCIVRSSRLEIFCKKSVRKNVAKFTGKHLCRSLFFIKLQDSVRPASLKMSFSVEHIWRLLLGIDFFAIFIAFLHVKKHILLCQRNFRVEDMI